MIERSVLFSTSIEAGLRSLGILEGVFPATLDLDRLVALDHIVVHSRDFDSEAPESLHPASPYRRAEPVVRRDLVRLGIDLMVARNLMHRIPTREGFTYIASETASPFIDSLQSVYWVNLFARARWAAERFGSNTSEELTHLIRQRVDTWISQFAELPLPVPEAS
jgi:hypothetical protein